MIAAIIMAAILNSASVDNEAAVSSRFTGYQIDAIYHEARKSLAEKAVRIGYTYAKAFRAVRKSLMKRKLTTLFTSKDQESSFEFIANCEEHIETFNHRRSVILRERSEINVPVFDDEGRDTGFVEKVTMSKIVLDNHSRILAFSSNPNALRSYGGDVMWDEAAFHQKGKAMWSAIQGRIRWGYDVDVWSSLAMQDTMFDVIAADAKRGKGGWKYSHVDIYEAVEDGLVELINEVRGTKMTREEFIADAREDAMLPDLFALEYEIKKSNTLAPIVPWETLKAGERPGLKIEREHLGQSDIAALFGRPETVDRGRRRRVVEGWLSEHFRKTLSGSGSSSRRYRLGFDVAASRKGDLASVWIEEKRGERARHRALLTFRTEDWDVMQWCLEILMAKLPGEVIGRGDETGLGRQICWNLAKLHHGRFEGVNFGSKKSEIGSALMARLAARGLDLSPDHADVTQDIYCLRKGVKDDRVFFFEAKNDLLPASHADIGWSAALAAYADMDDSSDVWVLEQKPS
jgi:phage FluMu gp28-like protein